MNALLLGLSSGPACLGNCAPVLVPYMLAGHNRTRANLLTLGQFLGGRLAGYLGFAVAVWFLSRSFVTGPGMGRIAGIVYVTLAFFVLWFAISPRSGVPCAVRGLPFLVSRIKRPLAVPVLAGFLSGIVLCPPFLLALMEASTKPTFYQTVFFFFMFFIGTSLFLLPLLLTGLARRFEAASFVGRVAAGIVGLWYLYSGVFLIAG